MDPNVCWQRIRALIAKGEIPDEERQELAELLIDLARWVERGGFLPCPFEAQENA